jgi:hypothetical protein
LISCAPCEHSLIGTAVSEPKVQPAEDPQGLGVDASHVFRWPLVTLGFLSGIAGALDAISFGAFGIFTANQAGNLVLIWVRLPTEPLTAALSVASILGSGLGIAFLILLRLRFNARNRVLPMRITLVITLIVLALTTIATSLVGINARSDPTQLIAENNWWYLALVVALSAMGLGVLGASVMVVRGQRTSVIGTTGAYISMVRLAMVRLSHGPVSISDWWTVAVIPVSWSLGAAVTALSNPSPIVATFAIVVVFTAVLLSLRRVANAAPG